MNSRELQLIEALINKEDSVRHNKAIEIIFHGTVKDGKMIKNAYVNAIENAVRQCFSGALYRGRFEEIYITFEAEFYNNLMKVKPDTLRSIDKLESWLYVASRNFANSHRKKITMALGIVETEVKSDILIDCCNDDADPSSWASDLLDSYIEQISCEYYRLILRAVVLEDMPREEFAEEQGKKDAAAIDRDVRRAKLELIKVAMADIKWRSRKVMSKYCDQIPKQAERNLLEDFFTGKPVKDINGLVNAISNLMKIAHRETKLDEAEEKRELRRQN